jgi:hypothetical protein
MTANLETTRRNLLFLLSAALGLPRGASGAEGKYPRNLTQADIDRWMKELSNWGRWGKEDQAGAVNLITPAKRRKAAALVREGWSVSMALNADLPKEGPTSGPAAAGPPGGASPGAGGPSARGGQQGASAAPAARGGLGGGVPRATWTLTSRPPTGAPRPLAAYVVDSFSVSYHGNYTSHLDSMAHLHFNGQIYNGFPTSAYTDRGAGKNDVLPFKDGIFTRGLLFDIPRLKGVKYLGDDEPIYPEDLEAWETHPVRSGCTSATWLCSVATWCRTSGPPASRM